MDIPTRDTLDAAGLTDGRFHDDWRTLLDCDGLPVANEDRVGDLFVHRTTRSVYACTLIADIGWVWYAM